MRYTEDRLQNRTKGERAGEITAGYFPCCSFDVFVQNILLQMTLVISLSIYS